MFAQKVARPGSRADAPTAKVRSRPPNCDRTGRKRSRRKNARQPRRNALQTLELVALAGGAGLALDRVGRAAAAPAGRSSSIVILNSRKVLTRTAGWRLTGYTTVFPAASGARKSQVRPNMCESGRTERRRSFAPKGKTSTRARALDATLPWVSITPFGSPVVPEVNMTSSRSSVARSAAGSGSVARARSGSDSIRITGRPSRRPMLLSGATRGRPSAASARRPSPRSRRCSRTSSGTPTWPAWARARNPSPHSGRLTAQITTRSPRVAPALRQRTGDPRHLLPEIAIAPDARAEAGLDDQRRQRSEALDRPPERARSPSPCADPR